MNTQVSIIIPSLNSPIIDQIITAIEQQSAWSAVTEIIIVGRDEPNLIPDHEKVVFIDTEQPVTAPVARNLGIARATADFLIFLDSDCLPQANWLAQHLHALTHDCDVAGGGVLPKGDNYWHLVYNLTLFHEFFNTHPPREQPYFPTLNLALKKEVIDRVGPLDETLDRGQDVEWTTRMSQAQFKLKLNPKAVIDHQHSRRTFRAVWRDCARSGYHMRQVRLTQQKNSLFSKLLNYRGLILGLSPLIALGVTGRIVLKNGRVFLRYPASLGGIYLTKIAWCVGAASRQAPT